MVTVYPSSSSVQASLEPVFPRISKTDLMPPATELISKGRFTLTATTLPRSCPNTSSRPNPKRAACLIILFIRKEAGRAFNAYFFHPYRM